MAKKIMPGCLSNLAFFAFELQLFDELYSLAI
jgi:hypothetical protein